MEFRIFYKIGISIGKTISFIRSNKRNIYLICAKIHMNKNLNLWKINVAKLIRLKLEDLVTKPAMERPLYTVPAIILILNLVEK